MAFIYTVPANNQTKTPTYESKQVLCKSFKIDIAGGSPFPSGSATTVGVLPANAQVVMAYLVTATAVSGGTVSACTLTVQVGGDTIFNAVNVFSAGANSTLAAGYMQGFPNSGDQLVTYNPTITGAGPTAGIIYCNILYVI